MTFPGYTAEDLTTLPAGRMRLCEEPETLTLERRRSGRIAQIRPVTVYEPYASRFFGGQTADVSATGMKLRMPAWVKLEPGRIIDLHAGAESGALPLPNRRKAVVCRVVWTHLDESADKPQWVVGVEFLSAISAEAA